MAATMFPISPLSDLEIVFAANVSHLMPPYADIPKDFKDGHTKWNRLFAEWFYRGLTDLKLTPRDGVDQSNAIRHIRAVMNSFEPAHEHKEAAVAYLLDQWFTDATWTAKKRGA